MKSKKVKQFWILDKWILDFKLAGFFSLRPATKQQHQMLNLQLTASVLQQSRLSQNNPSLSSNLKLPVKKLLVSAFCFFIFASLGGCGGGNKAKAPKVNQEESPKEVGGSFVFNQVTLEQTNDQGQTLWKVRGKQAIYSQDKKTAVIENPDGDLYQDGKVVLHLTATSGEVEQNGEKIVLKGQFMAKDTRNGAVLQGKELEWRPKEDLLIIKNNFIGNHAQLQAAAREGKYISRTQQMELSGQIVAVLKDPEIQMRTEHLIWDIAAQKVTGDRFIQIDRFKNKKATDQVAGDRAEVNLATKIATLKQNVQLTSLDPSMLMATNAAIWDLNGQIVTSDEPVKVVNPKEEVTLTANRGQFNLDQKVVFLAGGARGEGTRNQSQIYAETIRWHVPTQQFEAQGNVFYQQAKPPLNLTGSRAIGKLQAQTILVTSGDRGRVVTQITP